MSIESRPGQPTESLKASLSFAVALAAALIVGIVVAWSPRFWSVAVLLSGVLAIAAIGIWFLPKVRLPLQSIPFFLIASWGWIQNIFHWSVSAHLTVIRSLEWSTAAIAFLLTSNIFRSSKARSTFLTILGISSAAFCVLAILQRYTSPDRILWIFPAEPGSVGTFLYKNQFAAMLEMTAPTALYWIFLGKSRRTLGVVVFSCLLGGAFVSASRAGTLLIVFEVVAILIAARTKLALSRTFLSALILVTILAGAGVGYIVGLDNIITHFREPHPYLLRAELLRSTIAMWKEHPVAGTGLGTWSIIYPRFATFDLGVLANAAHNDWAEWLQEGGVVFALFIASLMALLIRPAFRSSWGLGIITIMLHSWVDYPAREPVILILWSCIAGAAVAADKEPPDHPPTLSTVRARGKS